MDLDSGQLKEHLDLVKGMIKDRAQTIAGNNDILFNTYIPIDSHEKIIGYNGEENAATCYSDENEETYYWDFGYLPINNQIKVVQRLEEDANVTSYFLVRYRVRWVFDVNEVSNEQTEHLSLIETKAHNMIDSFLSKYEENAKKHDSTFSSLQWDDFIELDEETFKKLKDVIGSVLDDDDLPK